MANIIKIKRGLKADVDKLVLLPGELGVTLDTQELYVGVVDGNKQLIKGAAAGVVESAEKLATARNIAASGDATGSASFDGTKDIEIALTLANSGVAAGTYTKVTVDEKGRVTTGNQLTTADLPTITVENVSGLSDELAKYVLASTYNNDMSVIETNLTGINQTMATKADASALNNYYKKTETYSATEIDSKIDAKDSLPAQANNAGKFLTTNGTTASWAEVDLSAKADVTALEELKGTVSELSTTVGTKASQASVTALSSTVDGHTASINTINGQITAINADLDEKADASALASYVTLAGSETITGAKDFTGGLTKNGKAVATEEYVGTQIDGVNTTINNLTTTVNNKANSADVYTKEAADELINAKATKATTLSGYGITDAYTKTEVDAKVAGTFKFVGEAASYDQLPTDAKAGDVYQVGEKEYAYDGENWVELGFNIDLTSYATKAEVSETYATKTALSEGLAAKADASSVYTKTETDNLLSAKATAADLTALTTRVTTAEGDIDALETEVAKKADSATTLAGYGITDAYTKTQVDAEISAIETTLATKLDASSTIDGGTF